MQLVDVGLLTELTFEEVGRMDVVGDSDGDDQSQLQVDKQERTTDTGGTLRHRRTSPQHIHTYPPSLNHAHVHMSVLGLATEHTYPTTLVYSRLV